VAAEQENSRIARIGNTPVTRPEQHRLKCLRPADTLISEVAITLRTDAWREGSAWLFVLLALLTVLPAACVLWFMNEALTRESAASHQRVLEAYRGQLRLVRSRLDPIWQAQAASLNAEAGSPEQRFQRLITSERAEGVILLTPEGAVEYPTRTAQQDRETETIEQQLLAAAAAKGDARKPMVDAIAARLNDYSRPMAAAARLGFMTRLRQLSSNVSLPTEAALRLSLDMLDAERPSPATDVVRQTAMPDVWALTSEDHRVIAFYRIGRVEEMMHDFLHPGRAERHHLSRGAARHARRLGGDCRRLMAAGLAAVVHADRVVGIRRGRPAASAALCLRRARRHRPDCDRRRRCGRIAAASPAPGAAEDRPGGRRLARTAQSARLDARAGRWPARR
jgi:hypothetical protein